ncbi:MAG TPA: hypothetical protein PKZ29_00150 [Candidatus Woesebacteria bacterium]|nr:hypothetical protein [Candidatus Woesebacteria bacterium]HOG37314.1 hypothetical protein [Candidatus Woesebacteria bacterium]
MKQKNLLLALAMAAIMAGSLVSPALVKADSYTSVDNRKTLSIDKKIRYIFSANYVDNISSSTKVFTQGDIVEFKIKVTNTGTTNMRNIKVTDQLPPFLKLIFFPGSYNKTDNKVEWTIDELNAGHSQEFLIRAKIDQATEVKTLTKETNVAIAKVDEISEKDDAVYYIGSPSAQTKGGQIIVPETGNVGLIFQTGGVISLGLAGLALRKKIRGY